MPSPTFSRLLGLPKRVGGRLRRLAADTRETIFPLRVIHRSGVRNPKVGPNDVVVVCLVRDGTEYIDEFLSHYRALGVSHIVFLDNGSTDGTRLKLESNQGVSVFTTLAPYKVYKDVMKRWLVTRFGPNNWVLCVDIDEFFDYPFRDCLPLEEFLRYLNEKSVNAVVAQLLDLFPSTALTLETSKNWRQSHCYYTLEQIERQPYREVYGERNVAPDIGLELFCGGSRSKTFDVGALLTKHPLQFPARGIVMRNAHHVTNGRIADISAVLLHYKYVGDFYNYAKRIASEESFSKDSEEYKKYVGAMESTRDLKLYDKSSRVYRGPEALLGEGFLVAGEEFRAYVGARSEFKTTRVI